MQPWRWLLPYLALAVPAWQAWHATCRIPWADHWSVLVHPWMKLQQGGSWWEFIHTPNNDSRHDLPRLIHAALMQWTGWNLRIESFVCVLLTAVAIWLSNRCWQRHPTAARLSLACGSALLITSPMQWMNWSWGIQICCLMAVAGGLATIEILCHGKGSLTRRTAWAAAAAAAAVFSFASGWLAWIIGTAALAVVPASSRSDRIRAAILWTAALALTLAAFLPGMESAGHAVHPEHTPPAVDGLLSHPLRAVSFFVQVAGAPFSEVWFWNARTQRVAAGAIAATITTVTGLTLLAMMARHWWQQRHHAPWPALVPWALLVLYGLGNSAAISIARFQFPDYSPFQSRYPSYTLWWIIGTIGLLCAMPAQHPIRRSARFLLPLTAWCWLCGAWQGWADCERIAWHSRNAEAAASLRHVAPEPQLLHRIFPNAPATVPPSLDALAKAGLLNVATFHNPDVTAAPRLPDGSTDGQIMSGEWENGYPILRGWAISLPSRREARSIIISFQPENGPEHWLGVATHRPREPKHAQRRHARALEDRIGWRFDPSELPTPEGIPRTWQRRSPPQGKVRFRAWVLDAVSGRVAPLRGEVVLDVPNNPQPGSN